MNQTLQEIYNLVTSTNTQHQRNRDHWRQMLDSYMGGVEWQRGQYLTKYVNETQAEYDARLAATPLENHCRSVISTYVSFLFRDKPHREFASIEYEPMLESFLEDADMDGRSFDAFMKEVAVWSSVFGHCWVIVAKPNVGALTKGDELANDVRPYLNLLTPLVVTDWQYQRLPNGRYDLRYLKYVEDVNDTVITVKEWYQEKIVTTVINEDTRSVISQDIEPNPLMSIPAICAYNQKSPVRGIGISDISDISRVQRFIYNMTSEVEASIRVNGHPTLVAPMGMELSAGAGAVLRMEDNLDPGLKPYILAFGGASLDAIYKSIEHTITAIDKMANIGAVRATQSITMSGVAMETEFQLLNARLSEKADNLELAEEQMWEFWFQYQGSQWMGSVEYPNSFNIRDKAGEINQLATAKTTATDPIVLRKIDEHILEWMGEEAELLPYQDINPIPGRTYPDGEPIAESLPPAYMPAEESGTVDQYCSNCEYWKGTEGYCTKFDANVRPVYWCAKWEPTVE